MAAKEMGHGRRLLLVTIILLHFGRVFEMDQYNGNKFGIQNGYFTYSQLVARTGLESGDVRFNAGSASNELCVLGQNSHLPSNIFPGDRWVRPDEYVL